MKPKFFNQATLAGALAAAALLPFSAKGFIVAPYTPDANTLHLWHLDEAAAPAVDSASGGINLAALANGATLGNPSYAGFGASLDTGKAGADDITTANRNAILTAAGLGTNVTLAYMDPVTSAFTYEAIVRIDFDPAQNMATVANGGNGRNAQCQIIDAENNSNPGRIFQLRIDPIGTQNNNPQILLEFINVHLTSGQQNLLAAIPTTGPDAIVRSNWYHVAVAYNGSPGTADNLQMYWTLMDTNRVAANQILSTNMAQNLLNAPTVFALGNIPRTPNANFLGKIDEVRISNIARTAGTMMFGSPQLIIVTDPSDTTVAVGQPARFDVVAAGQAPLSYQWRYNGTNIADATQRSFALLNAQLTNAGSYDVIVTNANSSKTSHVAILTIRTPLHLTWTGQASFDWDYATANWVLDSTSTATNYQIGDYVRFDASGVGSGFVNLTAPLSPSSVTVSSDPDYDFLTLNSAGKITGGSQLTKSGAGRLILEMNNDYTGPTAILAGTVQLGADGTPTGQGSLGSGPITNNGAIVLNRTGALSFNDLYGTGTLMLNAAATLSISGTNTLSGDVTLNAGTLALTTVQAQGNSKKITVNALGNPGTRFAISSGMTFGADVSLACLGTSDTPANRTQFAATSGTNQWNGPITVGGNGVCQITAEGTSTVLNINGNISADALTGPGSILLRGTGSGSINGTVNAPNASVNITDNSTWTLNSTGNAWTNTTVAAGTFRMGGNNVLPAGVVIKMAQAGSTGVLDLNGFNQQIGGLLDNGGTEIIANGSTNSDSLLTLHTAQTWTFGGSIRDVVSNGTHKVSLKLEGGGTLTLSSNSTYSGATTVAAGTLALSGVGAIGSSAVIDLASGATLDVSARTGGMSLAAAQTLKGNGSFNVLGSLANNGTIELKLNKTGATLSNDRIQGLSQITYGGTLKLDLSGDPLATGDSFKLFDAATYTGTFANFVPSTPGSGLAWDQSALASDGTVRVMKAAVSGPTISSVSVSGTNLVFTGSGGVPGAGFSVWSATNVTVALLNWVQVSSGNFDTRGDFSVSYPIAPGESQRFFTLRVP